MTVLCARCGKRPAVYILRKWRNTGFCRPCYADALNVTVYSAEPMPA